MSSAPTIIAFTGTKYHGKDSCADILMKHYPFFQRKSFARPIKDIVKIALDMTEEQVNGTEEQKEEIDPRWGISGRQACQIIGTDLFRERFPGIWVKNLHERMKQPKEHYVVSDLRFDDEVEMIKSYPGTSVIIKVVRPIEKTDHHKSDLGIDSKYVDYIIDNNGTLEDLEQKVLNILTKLI